MHGLQHIARQFDVPSYQSPTAAMINYQIIQILISDLIFCCSARQLMPWLSTTEESVMASDVQTGLGLVGGAFGINFVQFSNE